MTIPTLLADLRARNGWSVADLAERVGVHRVTAYSWEHKTDPATPGPELLKRILTAAGATAAEWAAAAELVAFGEVVGSGVPTAEKAG